jgi:hypothetical protein
MVFAHESWLHGNFTATYGVKTLQYKDNAWGGEGFSMHNYARDWDVNLIQWAVSHYDFKFIVPVDDDAFVCAPNLIHQLQLLPRTLSSFTMGFTRWDSYDNCFVLMTRDVARFFSTHYYSDLRPTHHPSTHFNFVGAGASFGGGWSTKVGDWVNVFAAHGMALVRRVGDYSPACQHCFVNRTRQGTLDGNPLCNEGRMPEWKEECEAHESNLRDCWFRDCYPGRIGVLRPRASSHLVVRKCTSPFPTFCCYVFTPAADDPDVGHEADGICHAMLIDHRSFEATWKKVSANAGGFFANPSRVCARRFLIDKIKRPEDMHIWWNHTRPSHLPSTWSQKDPTRSFYPDYSGYLLRPDTAVTRTFCKHVNPNNPAMAGPSVDDVKNFQDDW